MKARRDAEKLKADAREDAAQALMQGRRQVLHVIEAAQSRVQDAERAAAEAIERRDQMIEAEGMLESGVRQVIAALEKELTDLHARREAVRAQIESKAPSEELAELLAVGEENLVSAEAAAEQVREDNDAFFADFPMNLDGSGTEDNNA
jgi:hypothetical protein